MFEINLLMRMSRRGYLCNELSDRSYLLRFAQPRRDTQKFIERTLANYEQAGGLIQSYLSVAHAGETLQRDGSKALPDNVIPIGS